MVPQTFYESHEVFHQVLGGDHKKENSFTHLSLERVFDFTGYTGTGTLISRQGIFNNNLTPRVIKNFNVFNETLCPKDKKLDVGIARQVKE